MKKVFSILLVMAMLVCFMATSALAAEVTSGTASVSSATVNPGEQATVTVTVSNESGFAAYKLYVTYDSTKLSNPVASEGTVANTGTAGKIVVTYGNTQNVTSNSFSITFDVIGDCQAPYSVSAEFAENTFKAFGENAEQVILSYTNGAGAVSVKHTFDAGVVTKPDCVNDGYTTYTCTVCGQAHKADSVPALGHDWKDADCTNPKTCKVCGETEGDPVGHIGAEPVVENNKNASCTVAGSYDSVVYCSVCGVELSRTPVTGEKLPHTPGEAVKEKEVKPTCTEAGSYEEVVYCSECGEELSRTPKTTEALGHDWADATCTEPKTCKVCGVTEGEALGHKWVDADCTNPKHCSVCGVTEGEALGHDWVIDKAVAPTCTTTGLTEGKHCTRCGEKVEQKVIAALGHDIDPEKYGSDGTNHWLICNTCGQIASEKVPHNYNVKGTDGYWYCVCGAKGDKIDTDTGKDEQPKNGDITPYFVMGVATLVAMSAAVVYVDKKRKSAR